MPFVGYIFIKLGGKTKQKERKNIAAWCLGDVEKDEGMETPRGSGRSRRDRPTRGPVRLGVLGDSGASLLCNTNDPCLAGPTEQPAAAGPPSNGLKRQQT